MDCATRVCLRLSVVGSSSSWMSRRAYLLGFLAVAKSFMRLRCWRITLPSKLDTKPSSTEYSTFAEMHQRQQTTKLQKKTPRKKLALATVNRVLDINASCCAARFKHGEIGPSCARDGAAVGISLLKPEPTTRNNNTQSICFSTRVPPSLFSSLSSIVLLTSVDNKPKLRPMRLLLLASLWPVLLSLPANKGKGPPPSAVASRLVEMFEVQVRTATGWELIEYRRASGETVRLEEADLAPEGWAWATEWIVDVSRKCFL